MFESSNSLEAQGGGFCPSHVEGEWKMIIRDDFNGHIPEGAALPTRTLPAHASRYALSAYQPLVSDDILD